MKDEILQTSLKQFLKFGIREMSIQNLVAPLGISTKTVYKYFDNKEQLLKEALRLYYVQQYKLLEEFSANKNVVSLLFDIWLKGIETECKVNRIFFQDLHYYYPELEKKVESTVGKKFWKEFFLIIEQGIGEGVFRENIRPDVVLELIALAYEAIARKGLFKKFRTSTNVIYLNTIAIYIRGCCTLKGIKQLEEHINHLQLVEEVKHV
jgi:AcrR family transcriptional regulator